MKASKQQDAAIATEAAVESESVVNGAESTVMEQAADTSGTEIAEELVAAESAAEDQPHGETVQEAAATPDPTDFAEIYRARLIASAIQNAQRMTEYGAYLSQHVPSATEGIGQLVNLYQDAARKCVAEWH